MAQDQTTTTTETPLCAVHKRVDENGNLEMQIGGNNCIACSLNERKELLDILAPVAPPDGSEDSVTVLRRAVEFYETHAGANRVVVSYPAPQPPLDAGEWYVVETVNRSSVQTAQGDVIAVGMGRGARQRRENCDQIVSDHRSGAAVQAIKDVINEPNALAKIREILNA